MQFGGKAPPHPLPPSLPLAPSHTMKTPRSNGAYRCSPESPLGRGRGFPGADGTRSPLTSVTRGTAGCLSWRLGERGVRTRSLTRPLLPPHPPTPDSPLSPPSPTATAESVRLAGEPERLLLEGSGEACGRGLVARRTEGLRSRRAHFPGWVGRGVGAGESPDVRVSLPGSRPFPASNIPS